MDVAMFTNLLSSVGFPIACCIALFWYVNKMQEIYNNSLDELRVTINNNTCAMNELLHHINSKQ